MKTLWYALQACVVAAVPVLGIGCDDEGGDEGGDDGPGATSSVDGDGEGDGADGSGAACSEACSSLAGDAQCAGFEEAMCTSTCSNDACATCLSESDACGADCEAACAGGSSAESGNDDTSDSGSAPQPECIADDECGISFECISCGLTDGEGWCVQTESCTFDTDCGSGGKCGYNVQSGDYRCLPGEYCQ